MACADGFENIELVFFIASLDVVAASASNIWRLVAETLIRQPSE
jgi:hypothetical protein